MKETKSMANLYGGSGILGGGYASIASSWEDMLEEAQTTIVVGRVKAGVGRETVGCGIGMVIAAGRCDCANHGDSYSGTVGKCGSCIGHPFGSRFFSGIGQNLPRIWFCAGILCVVILIIPGRPKGGLT